jgi:hypothetical protein
VACVQLDAQQRCKLFGQPSRPVVCSSLRPSLEMCGPDRSHAVNWLTWLEYSTLPARP